MNCIFCDIIDEKAHAEILYEDKDIISFLDIRPVNFGHTLVIPKAHYENFTTVPGDTLMKLVSITQLMSDAIVKSLKPDGFNLIANNGAAAGQTIYHFHFHIIPRYFKDDFNFKLNLKNYIDSSMHEYADKIRLALNS